MRVARATCPDCEAKYLAWCSWPGNQWNEWAIHEVGYFALSFRSTFNAAAAVALYHLREVAPRT